MKILLVFNPYAGHGHAGKLLPGVEKTFKDCNIDFDLEMTHYPGNGVEIVSKADLKKYNDWLVL